MITEIKTPYSPLSDDGLNELFTREQDLFIRRTPQSRDLYRRARKNLLNGVPMPWMGDWGTPHPVFVREAAGNRLWDIDGNEYLDFCLGDTGAMFGHSPEPTALAVERQVRRGITTMLPGEDSLWVGREMHRRFGLPFWQFAMTATEANRYVFRICRTLTGRPKVLCMNECYHGSLDETLPHRIADGRLALRSEYDMNPGVDKEKLTRVVEFNDLSALETELAHGDVACVITEPVMTNCGMVLPDEGYLEELEVLCRRFGCLLIYDETHTFSNGPGGYTAAEGLKPDFITVGKSIAGGIPIAAYGFSEEVAHRINASFGGRGVSDPMGIGGTLSANIFALAAMKATLSDVATEKAFNAMFAGQQRLSEGLDDILTKLDLPWTVTRSGARCELQFMPRRPVNGTDAKNHFDWQLMYYIHLFLNNRGFIITPFHNMMLIPPMATASQIDSLVAAWSDCLVELRVPDTLKQPQLNH